MPGPDRVSFRDSRPGRVNLVDVNTLWTEATPLEGDHVRLEPLSPEHAPGLHEAGRSPSVWTWLSLHPPADVAATRELIDNALADRGRLAWAQIDLSSGRVAGTTSYYDIDPEHRGLAIGHTWIGEPWQRTALNTEAKLLLLRRAFRDLGAVRVTWHTDIHNERSQRAIERLGAVREGVLRAHRIRKDGTLRDTVSYSMTADEWPAAEAALTARLKITSK